MELNKTGHVCNTELLSRNQCSRETAMNIILAVCVCVCVCLALTSLGKRRGVYLYRVLVGKSEGKNIDWKTKA
jgi:hypothetical protein